MIKITLPSWLHSPRIYRAIGNFSYQYLKKRGHILFSDLLIERRDQMWRSVYENEHTAEACEKVLMGPAASFDEWHCCSHWQRKLSNKINAKYFVQQQGVNVAKLYWVGKDPGEIPFETLPPKYVVKLSNGWCSAQVMPVSYGKNVFTNMPVTTDEVVAFFVKAQSNKKFKHTYVFVEEFIQAPTDDILPMDYKLWCFNGEVKLIQVMDELNSTHTWYAKNWVPVNDQMHFEFRRGPVTAPPKELPDLIRTAEQLAIAYDYKFVRIDLYISNGAIYFGEFTHTPYVNKTISWFTPYANILLAELWTGKKTLPISLTIN